MNDVMTLERSTLSSQTDGIEQYLHIEYSWMADLLQPEVVAIIVVSLSPLLEHEEGLLVES